MLVNIEYEWIWWFGSKWMGCFFFFMLRTKTHKHTYSKHDQLIYCASTARYVIWRIPYAKFNIRTEAAKYGNVCKDDLGISRWWFPKFFNLHPYLGKWSSLTDIFSDGLKPPPSDSLSWEWSSSWIPSGWKPQSWGGLYWFDSTWFKHFASWILATSIKRDWRLLIQVTR